MFKKSSDIKELIKYVDKSMSGYEVQQPVTKNKQINALKDSMDIMLDYKSLMGGVSKNLMAILGGISNFDVGLSHISNNLTKYASNLTDYSSSNLSIVEETTASMNQVNESIEEATNTLSKLAKESNTLSSHNNETQLVLKEVNDLKEKVLVNSNDMNNRIEELISLVKGIEDIVANVQEIADQINLLALNASIEAARAGEHGKGFAVVADEVSKLADTTKEQLSGMQQFVQDIYNASNAGKDSVDRVLASTEEMSDKIDMVSDTVNNNIVLLDTVIDSVNNINDSMQVIRATTGEVNMAMEQCSKDAEEITAMSHAVNAAANESVQYAEGMGILDDKLTDITVSIYSGVNEKLSIMSNEEFLEIIEKAIDAHEKWVESIKLMVKDMKARPLQINGKKCAFGHYHTAINMDQTVFAKEWNDIGEVHMKLHNQGSRIIQSIMSNDDFSANQYLGECVKISGNVIDRLTDIKNKVQAMITENINVF